MSEHYTKNTYEVTEYCKTCGRITRHDVSNGRRGPWLEHRPAIKKRAPRPKQLSMFEDRK